MAGQDDNGGKADKINNIKEYNNGSKGKGGRERQSCQTSLPSLVYGLARLEDRPPRDLMIASGQFRVRATPSPSRWGSWGSQNFYPILAKPQLGATEGARCRGDGGKHTFDALGSRVCGGGRDKAEGRDHAKNEEKGKLGMTYRYSQSEIA